MKLQQVLLVMYLCRHHHSSSLNKFPLISHCFSNVKRLTSWSSMQTKKHRLIYDLIIFIVSCENILYMTWGWKFMRTRGEIHVLAKEINRKQITIVGIYNYYWLKVVFVRRFVFRKTADSRNPILHREEGKKDKESESSILGFCGLCACGLQPL